MTPLEQGVLAEITPTPAEEAAAARAVADLEAEATRALAEAGLPGAAAVQGSLAKGTWLKGGADIDLFLLLDPAVPLDELESVAERVGRRILEKPQKKYAQHPYLQGFFRGQAVDLVPAYRVASAHAKMSAVDRTPFHTAWVRTRLDARGRGEVRLAKRWMKGVGVYGAET
ncbi:MAG TPA: nucleotidyltransferase domain-containing protein, partial [Candidatus Thermoplasmatota archaeon]|nr:nucleotidyltransferase domain-containing protein [Candidatus Thermoplasmatota archaeon]